MDTEAESRVCAWLICLGFLSPVLLFLSGSVCVGEHGCVVLWFSISYHLVTSSVWRVQHFHRCWKYSPLHTLMSLFRQIPEGAGNLAVFINYLTSSWLNHPETNSTKVWILHESEINSIWDKPESWISIRLKKKKKKEIEIGTADRRMICSVFAAAAAH